MSSFNRRKPHQSSRHGLTQLLRTQNPPGLLALINAAGYGKDDTGKGKNRLHRRRLRPSRPAPSTPLGRMGHAREASVELLTTATPERAEEIAQYLESQNKERRSKERKMLEVARAQIENRKSKIVHEDAVLVVSHESSSRRHRRHRRLPHRRLSTTAPPSSSPNPGNGGGRTPWLRLLHHRLRTPPSPSNTPATFLTSGGGHAEHGRRRQTSPRQPRRLPRPPQRLRQRSAHRTTSSPLP